MRGTVRLDLTPATPSVIIDQLYEETRDGQVTRHDFYRRLRQMVWLTLEGLEDEEDRQMLESLTDLPRA